jgi:DNA polymerase-3 subunit beta
VLIEAKANALTFRASNLDQELTMRLDGDIAAPGSICINAKQLLAFVKSTKAAFVSFKSGDGSLECAAGEDAFSLNALPASDFPTFEARKPICSFAVPALDLRTLIEKTAFAVSNEETRYYLNGIYLHTANGSLRSVTTDGHRLAWRDVASPENSDLMPGCIVPNAALPTITAMTKSGAALLIEIAHMQMTVCADDVTLRTKLIDGTFPEYGRVIPSLTPESVEIDRKAFTDKIKLVMSPNARSAGAVKLAFDTERMTITRNDPDNGNKTATLACVGEDSGEIGFNPRYLLSILETIEAPRVRLDYTDTRSPCILRAAGRSASGRNEAQGAVIMPMRV